MISFDTNILIYALEGHREFGFASQEIIKHADLNGGCVSILLKQEILAGSILHKGQTQQIRSALESFMGIEFINITDEVITKSLELTEQFGSKCYGYDALILASAITGGANKFFTNDKTLLSLKIPGISIRSL